MAKVRNNSKTEYANFFRQLYNKELSMGLYDDAPGWAYVTLQELKIKEHTGYALFKVNTINTKNDFIYIAVVELNRKKVARKLRHNIWRRIHWTSRLILNYYS